MAIKERHSRHALDKFFESPVCQDARVQVELPNGEIMTILLVWTAEKIIF